MAKPFHYIGLGLQKIATIHGRSTRSEHNWFWLLTIVEGAVAVLLMRLTPASWFDQALIVLVCLNAIPLITLTCRRLHDIGFPSFTLVIAWVIPYGGLCMTMILAVWPSNKGDNRYGPDHRNDMSSGPAQKPSFVEEDLRETDVQAYYKKHVLKKAV